MAIGPMMPSLVVIGTFIGALCTLPSLANYVFTGKVRASASVVLSFQTYACGRATRDLANPPYSER